MRVTDQIRALLDQIDAPAKPAVNELPVPTNWVRVRPPFPRHPPGYRDYPDPQFVSNYEGKPVDTITGYASSAQGLWSCNNFDYRTQGGRLYQLSDRHNAMQATEGKAAYPKILDELAFPDDYSDPSVPQSPEGTWVSGGNVPEPGSTV